MSHLQPSELDVPWEGLDVLDVIAVHVQHVDVLAEALVRYGGQVTLRAVRHPVDAKVVTVTVDRALLLDELAVQAEHQLDQQHQY